MYAIATNVSIGSMMAVVVIIYCCKRRDPQVQLFQVLVLFFSIFLMLLMLNKRPVTVLSDRATVLCSAAMLLSLSLVWYGWITRNSGQEAEKTRTTNTDKQVKAPPEK